MFISRKKYNRICDSLANLANRLAEYEVANDVACGALDSIEALEQRVEDLEKDHVEYRDYMDKTAEQRKVEEQYIQGLQNIFNFDGGVKRG